MKLSQDTMVEEAINLQKRMFNLINDFNCLSDRFDVVMKEMDSEQTKEFNERFGKLWGEWNK